MRYASAFLLSLAWGQRGTTFQATTTRKMKAPITHTQARALWSISWSMQKYLASRSYDAKTRLRAAIVPVHIPVSGGGYGRRVYFFMG